MAVGLVALLLACLTAAAPRHATSAEKVRIAYPVPSMAMIPAWIAKDLGFFRDEGLDVEMPFISSATAVVQALLAGEVQAGVSVGAPPIVAAIAQGAELTIPAVPGNRMDYVLVSRAPVRAPHWSLSESDRYQRPRLFVRSSARESRSGNWASIPIAP